jgi:peptide/nickel transport system permease protein
MAKFLLRRFVFLFLTMFLVSVGTFAISELAPGNIAINTLGNTITPEQEASFNSQNGLDDPPLTRYVRWLLGSDWHAERVIGKPITRIRDKNGRLGWWVVDDDGTLFQSFTPDGETLMRRQLQADGTFVETQSPNDQWVANEDGIEIFWGINASQENTSRAAMWVRGSDSEEWVLTSATWTSATGAPQDYIPLQRGLLRGDPGVSLKDRRPVAEVLPRRLLNTVILAGVSFVFIMPIALVLGLIAGLNEGRYIDRFLSITSLIATATPTFASGVFLIIIFSFWLGWLPGAVVLVNDRSLFENPEMLVLPVLTLTLIELGYVLRITRSSMVEVMRTNYIRTAELKGLPSSRIVFKHALRNALLAPITIIMLHVNWLIGGIVVVEQLFGYPGLGRYVLEAALFKDVFSVEAAAMLLVVVAVGTQLVSDIIYTFLNPRIRYA